MRSSGLKRIMLAVAGIAVLWAPGRAPAQGTATETVGFSIQIEPVFTVNSASEEGGTIDLGPVGPDQSPVSRRAVVSVRSNTGRPYRILQRLEEDPGKAQILFSVTDGVNGGRSRVSSPTALTLQPVEIFSNPQGISDQFHVTYSVSSDLLPAGEYRARILIEEELR